MQAAGGTARAHGGHAGPGRESRPSLAVVRGRQLSRTDPGLAQEARPGDKMGAASAGLLAPRSWASRRPRSRATLFPAAAARLLLLLLVASQPSGKALLCSLTRGTWRLFPALDFFFPLACPGCGRWCKAAVTLKTFLLLFLFILREISSPALAALEKG